jgi:hypothetical protein
MQQNSGAIGGILEILDHTLEIKTLSLLIEVSVLSDVHTASRENGVVVTPSWRADVDWGWSELDQEITDHLKGTGSGEGLGGSDSTRGDVWVVPAEEDSSGTLGKLWISIDG